MTDLRALCARMAAELDHYRQLLSDDRRELHPLAVEARAALAQPEPEVVGPSDEELADTYWDAWHKHFDRTNSVLHSVGLRAVLSRWGLPALAQPEPEVVGPPPSEQLVEQWVAEVWHEGTPVRVAASDLHLAAKAAEWGARWGRPAPAPAGEVGELVAWLSDEADQYDCIKQAPDVSRTLRRAAELLERQAAPVPVAVSERLPGAEDCDAEERCWWWRVGRDGVGDWIQKRLYPSAAACAFLGITHWLPAHALPLPSGEVEE